MTPPPCAAVTPSPLVPHPQIATTRKLTVHLRPPASCDLEITLQGIKLILTVAEYSRDEEVRSGGARTPGVGTDPGAGRLPCFQPTSPGSSLPVRALQPLLPDEEHLLLRVPPPEQLVRPPPAIPTLLRCHASRPCSVPVLARLPRPQGCPLCRGPAATRSAMGQVWGAPPHPQDRCGVPPPHPAHPHSYFGFITKHPVLSRFACHVFVSQESMRHVAECVGYDGDGDKAAAWRTVWGAGGWVRGAWPRWCGGVVVLGMAVPGLGGCGAGGLWCWGLVMLGLGGLGLQCWGLDTGQALIPLHCAPRPVPPSCAPPCARLLCPPCSRAFQEYYQEHLEYACPTEDIYLE